MDIVWLRVRQFEQSSSDTFLRKKSSKLPDVVSEIFNSKDS